MHVMCVRLCACKHIEIDMSSWPVRQHAYDVAGDDVLLLSGSIDHFWWGPLSLKTFLIILLLSKKIYCYTENTSKMSMLWAEIYCIFF